MFYIILAYVMPVLKHHYVILYVFICSIFHAPYSVALFLCVMSLKEVLCFLNYNSAESEYSYHIRDCHKSIEDIGYGSYSLYRHIWSNEYSKYVQPAIDLDRLHPSTCEIFKASLRIIVPAQNRCKCKEYKAQHE